MAIAIRAEDSEHFSIVRDTLVGEGLHVAMLGQGRRLQDYAARLAREVAQHSGFRVEAYQASKLESIVVDLMLYRFDSALERISATTPPRIDIRRASASSPACVMFIANAEALPLPEFTQLLRLASGTRDHSLRLVVLFNTYADPSAIDERLRAMGTQILRWDLDAEEDTRPARRLGLASSKPQALLPRQVLPRPSLAASAAVLSFCLASAALLVGHLDSSPLVSTQATQQSQQGRVELAGEPSPAFTAAPPAVEATTSTLSPAPIDSDHAIPSPTAAESSQPASAVQ